MPIPVSALLRPDDIPAPATQPVAGQGWIDAAWTAVTGWAGNTPAWLWMAAAITLGLAALLTFPMLRTQAFKAGQRAGKPRAELSDEDRQDRKLLIAALVPASLFWVAVLVGSARGLTAFGRDDLKWTDGWEFLVPFTLDGVAIAFALLAFRAVKKGLNPDRATRIAWAAMLASAGLNFFHEIGGSSLGAVYLAILSVLGMLIFHEFLAQFEEGADYVARQNPKFGMRWFTWPTNTVCAWFAWRNYPPEVPKDTRVTVRLAVQHLDQVRAEKRAKRAAQVDAGWMRLMPWTLVPALRLALDTERATAAADIGELRNEVSDLASLLDRTRTQLDDTTHRLELVRVDRDTAAAHLDTAHAEITELAARLNQQTAELTTLRTGVSTHQCSQPVRTPENPVRVRSEPTRSQQPSQSATHGADRPASAGEFASENSAENPPRKAAANLTKAVQRPTHPLADDPVDSVRKLARAYSRKPDGTNGELAKLAKVSDGTANRYLPKVRAAFAAAENGGSSQLRTPPPLTELPIPAPDPLVTAGTNGAHLTLTEETP